MFNQNQLIQQQVNLKYGKNIINLNKLISSLLYFSNANFFLNNRLVKL